MSVRSSYPKCSLIIPTPIHKVLGLISGLKANFIISSELKYFVLFSNLSDYLVMVMFQHVWRWWQRVDWLGGDDSHRGQHLQDDGGRRGARRSGGEGVTCWQNVMLIVGAGSGDIPENGREQWREGHEEWVHPDVPQWPEAAQIVNTKHWVSWEDMNFEDR